MISANGDDVCNQPERQRGDDVDDDDDDDDDDAVVLNDRLRGHHQLRRPSFRTVVLLTW